MLSGVITHAMKAAPIAIKLLGLNNSFTKFCLSSSGLLIDLIPALKNRSKCIDKVDNLIIGRKKKTYTVIGLC